MSTQITTSKVFIIVCTDVTAAKGRSNRLSQEEPRELGVASQRKGPGVDIFS